jgi:hypothetical protein
MAREQTSALINLSRKSGSVMWPGHGKSTSLKKSICQVSRHIQQNKDSVGKEKKKQNSFFIFFILQLLEVGRKKNSVKVIDGKGNGTCFGYF